MIKRKFGMHCLNISQGRFGGYSHKNNNAYDLCGADSGIDYFYADCTLEVVATFPYSSTGFANTVIFYDAENDVTLAMTHENTIPARSKVGNKYYAGEVCYMEGTQSARGGAKVTGNHIHLEIGKGLQKNKVKMDGEWKLINQINIEDYFYIDTTFTKTIINCPYRLDNQKNIEVNKVHTIHVDKIGLYLRDSIRGKIKIYVKPGSSYSFDKLEPIRNRQADGYQWFRGTKGSNVYYMQYDSSCYWLE